MWIMAATWAMALEGSRKAAEILRSGGSGREALEALIRDVEDDPCFTSVGYGGLPDKEGHVTLDAAYMDGTTLRTGAVIGLEGYASPFLAAEKLSERETDTILFGTGAAEFAERTGIEQKKMLTEASLKKWKETIRQETTGAYRGHDTVGAVVLDEAGRIYAGTSTSGLFLKETGRVGDSPLIGSGFYADAEIGAAAATGLGEDIMKGCLSYEVVRRMKDGMSPQEACVSAVRELDERLTRIQGKAGDLSITAVSKDGYWGAASNIDTFSVVTVSDRQDETVYVFDREKCIPVKADKLFVTDYMNRHGKQHVKY